MITMSNICKNYKVARRNAGFGEAVRSLFHREYETITALDNVIAIQKKYKAVDKGGKIEA